MAGLNRDYWPCPFCDKGIIEVLIRPSSYKHQRTYGAGKGSINVRVSEQVIITSERCTKCGKVSEEIEKKWRKDGLL